MVLGECRAHRRRRLCALRNSWRRFSSSAQIRRFRQSCARSTVSRGIRSRKTSATSSRSAAVQPMLRTSDPCSFERLRMYPTFALGKSTAPSSKTASMRAKGRPLVARSSRIGSDQEHQKAVDLTRSPSRRMIAPTAHFFSERAAGNEAACHAITDRAWRRRSGSPSSCGEPGPVVGSVSESDGGRRLSCPSTDPGREVFQPNAMVGLCRGRASLPARRSCDRRPSRAPPS